MKVKLSAMKVRIIGNESKKNGINQLNLLINPRG